MRAIDGLGITGDAPLEPSVRPARRDRRSQRDARLRASAAFDQPDLRFTHTGLSHALARSIEQRREIGALHAAHRQKLLLRGNPFGYVKIDQRLTFAYTIKRSAHMHPFDKTGPVFLDDGLIVARW